MIIPAPPGKVYTPFQVKGIRYAMGGRGTIIADEMGLGKTVQAIGVINATPDPGTLNVLIICPAGLRLNWWKEIDEWLVTSCRISVASYHETEAIAESIKQFDPADRTIDILIIDEAHYIKNPKSQRAQNCERIAAHAKRVLALSGTPAENCPIELWQLLKIVCPEKWNQSTDWPAFVQGPEYRKSHPGEGPSFWEYAKRYCDLKRVSYTIGKGANSVQRSSFDFGGASNLDELNTKLRKTCMIRRLKADVLQDLPEIRRQLIVLESKADDSDLFPELSDETYFDVLRKLTSDKVAFSEWSTRRHEQALAKVDGCLRFIGDALDESEKIIVFAHHKDVVANLRIGIDCEFTSDAYSVVITGDTPMKEREAAVKAFQTDPRCRVIVGTLGAMGVGWTLTASQHVIMCELDPVPGRLSQAESRPHRIGQKGSVLVQHLVSNGSLCARMAKIVVRKQGILRAALDGPFGGTLTYGEFDERDPLP